MFKPDLIIIGGGLSGSEAAWQAAQRGLRVRLYEMRPTVSTGAHRTSDLAELVCSNSLGSSLPDRASGILKNELRRLGSLLMDSALKSEIPAGNALAVDREIFSRRVTQHLCAHPGIEIVRQEVVEIPTGLTIIASGPLTSKRCSQEISKLVGEEHLYFYDALAPIVSSDSINMEIAFRSSRYGSREAGIGDYINCPLSKEEYDTFIEALLSADHNALLPFETGIKLGVKAGAQKFFEGCLPVEIIAQRNHQALVFGPMRPTGLTNPRTGRWPFSVVQLRQDNLAGTLYNLVGFQTNLTFSEQRRVFRLIPGLEKAVFVRYGHMHRNTFMASPKTLFPTLQSRIRSDLFFCGQITGVEGYMGNIATGLLAGVNAARLFHGQEPITLPETTMLGALCSYISHADNDHFQPMKANFGILAPLDNDLRMDKGERSRLFSKQSQGCLETFLVETDIL